MYSIFGESSQTQKVLSRAEEATFQRRVRTLMMPHSGRHPHAMTWIHVGSCKQFYTGPRLGRSAASMQLTKAEMCEENILCQHHTLTCTAEA